MIEEQLNFNWLIYFEHESENEPEVLQCFGSEFVPIAHAQGEERQSKNIISLVWQSNKFENNSNQEPFSF